MSDEPVHIEGYSELSALLSRAERAEPPPLRLRPTLVTEDEVRAAVFNAVTFARAERNAYARRAILTTWILTALFSALLAWALRQPLFARLGVPPDMVPVIVVAANGFMWLCATRYFWFWPKRRG